MSLNPNYRANPSARYLPMYLNRSNLIAPMVANAVEGFTSMFSGKDRDGDGLKDGSFRDLKAKTKKYKDDTAEERAKMYDYKINVDEDDPNLKNYDYSATSLAEAAKTGKLKTNQERFVEKYDFDPSNVMYKFDKEKDAISARAIPVPKGVDAEEYLKQSRKTLGDAGYGDLASAKSSLADFVTDKTVAPNMPGMGGIAGSFNQALSSDAMRDFTKEQALKNINKNLSMKYGGQPKFQGDSGPSETSNLAMALRGAMSTADNVMPEDVGENEREAMLNTLTGKDLEKYKVWLQILDEREKLMGNPAYKKEYDRVQNVKKKLVDLVTKVGEDDESTLLDLGVPKNTLNWLSKGPSGREGDYYWSCSTAGCAAYRKAGATDIYGNPIKIHTSNKRFDNEHKKLGFRMLPQGTVPFEPGQYIRGHAYSEPGGEAGSRHALIYAGPGKIYQNTRGIPSDQPGARHAFESAATPYTEDGRYDLFFTDDYYDYDTGVMEYIGKLSKWEDKKLQPLLEKFRKMEGRDFELEERQKKYPDYKGDIKFNEDGDIIPSGFVNPNAAIEQLQGTGTDPQQMIEIMENAPNQSGNVMPSGGGSSSDFNILNPFTWFKEGGESIPDNPGFNELPIKAQMNIINNMNMGGERQMRYTDILQQARYGLPEAQMNNSEQPTQRERNNKFIDEIESIERNLQDNYRRENFTDERGVFDPSASIPADEMLKIKTQAANQQHQADMERRLTEGIGAGTFEPGQERKLFKSGQGFGRDPFSDFERMKQERLQGMPKRPISEREFNNQYKERTGVVPPPGAYQEYVKSFGKGARYGLEEYQGTRSSETGLSISDRLDMSDMMANVQAGFDRSRNQNFSVNPFLPQPNPLQMFMSQHNLNPGALDAYNLATSLGQIGQGNDPAITGVVDANGNPVAPGNIPQDIIKPQRKPKEKFNTALTYNIGLNQIMSADEQDMMKNTGTYNPFQNIGGTGGIGLEFAGDKGNVFNVGLTGTAGRAEGFDPRVIDKSTGQLSTKPIHTNIGANVGYKGNMGEVNFEIPNLGSLITGSDSGGGQIFRGSGKINFGGKKKPEDPTGDNKRYGGSSNEIEVDTATLAKLMKAGAKIKIV